MPIGIPVEFLVELLEYFELNFMQNSVRISCRILFGFFCLRGRIPFGLLQYRRESSLPIGIFRESSLQMRISRRFRLVGILIEITHDFAKYYNNFHLFRVTFPISKVEISVLQYYTYTDCTLSSQIGKLGLKIEHK